MDDIIIFSRTFAEYIEELGVVFNSLREANISLKAAKCVIASDEVDFLGYPVSKNGIKPLDRLVIANQ